MTCPSGLLLSEGMCDGKTEGTACVAVISVRYETTIPDFMTKKVPDV